MRPISSEEKRFRDLYVRGNETLFATPSSEAQMESWPCFAQLDSMTLYSIREIGIDRYFRTMVEEHPDWNVFAVRQPRYFPALLHKLNYIKILCVQHGGCTLTLDCKDYRLTVGDLCFLSPDIVHSVGAFADDAIALNIILRRSIAETCFVSFLSRNDILSSFFTRLLYRSDASPIMIFHTGEDKQIQRVLSCLEEETYVIQDYSTIQMTEGYLLELFALLTRHHWDDVTVIDRSQNFHDENLVACLRYFYQHGTEISLNELAERFHYSSSQLSKLIKRYTGSSFLEFVRSRKLEKAAALLSAGALSMKQVAETSGFSDSSHFYRCFRKQYGMTPMEYRNSGEHHQ